MLTNITAFIFARGGSKGIKKKNLQKIGNKTLLEHSISTAMNVKRVSKVVVSTDDREIASVALKAGAHVPFIRPANLSTDDASEWKAWQHAIHEFRSLGEKIDIFLSIPTTSPLRNIEDVNSCLDKLESGNADIVITVKKSERSPYFNMIALDEYSNAHLVINSKYYRRQDAPQVYDITTVAYAARADFILKSTNMFEGNVQTSLVPPERAIDIDTPHDLNIARLIYNQSLIID